MVWLVVRLINLTHALNKKHHSFIQRWLGGGDAPSLGRAFECWHLLAHGSGHDLLEWLDAHIRVHGNCGKAYGRKRLWVQSERSRLRRRIGCESTLCTGLATLIRALGPFTQQSSQSLVITSIEAKNVQ